MFWLLIKLINCFKDYIKIPKCFFTNEHLEQFFGVQIRIPKCWIQIHPSNPSKLEFKQKWRKWFESLKGGFESHFQRVQIEEGDSNPSKEDSNSRFQNVQAEESKDNDSNLYGDDSNPDSSKGCSGGWIQIFI